MMLCLCKKHLVSDQGWIGINSDKNGNYRNVISGLKSKRRSGEEECHTCISVLEDKKSCMPARQRSQYNIVNSGLR